MEAEDYGRSLTENHEVYTPMSVLGKRGRPTMDVVEPSNGSQVRRDRRRGVDAFRTALVAEL